MLEIIVVAMQINGSSTLNNYFRELVVFKMSGR